MSDMDDVLAALDEAEAHAAAAEEADDFDALIAAERVCKELRAQLWELDERASHEEWRDMMRNRPIW
jgi:hypothetical protein